MFKKGEGKMKKGIKTLSNGIQVINCTPHILKFEDGSVVEPSGYLLQAKMEEKVVSENPAVVEITISPTPEGLKELEEIERNYPEAIILGSTISAQAYPERVKMVVLTKPRADVKDKICRIDKFSIYFCKKGGKK